MTTNTFIPSIEMKNWTIFNNSLDNTWKNYIQSNPEKLQELLLWTFWPWVVCNTGDLRNIKITDVTLREWDQAPLTSFNKEEKKFVYLMLRELWIQTIEVWFPAWDTDFENVAELVNFFSDDPNPPTISVLWRALEFDTNKSIDAIKKAKKIRIHTFIASSKADIMWKFCKDWKTYDDWKEFVIKSIKNQLTKLKEIQKQRNTEWKEMEIEFSPEDATNTDFDFLLKSIRTAIKSWANIINVPDTLWIATPDSYKTLFFLLVDKTLDLKNEWYNFEFSTHVHNDKAMALATAIWWVRWWAKQVESTILWIWERTWNTSTHQSYMALWIDWKSNWWFKIDWINERHFWNVVVSVWKILWDDSFNREPWVWINSQKDWSWVHWANPNLYWWSKVYADKLWVKDSENYFSPRWWKNNIIDLLNMLWFENNLFLQYITPDFIASLSKKWEIWRTQYATQLFKDYLISSKRFNNFKYKITNNEIEVSFKLDWKGIHIKESYEKENWAIDALIKWFKKYLWKYWEKIELVDYQTREKPSLRAIIEETTLNDASEYYKQKIWKILSSLHKESNSESIWLIHFKFNINWKERNSVTFWNNVENATIVAIVDVFLPEIIKLKWF